MNRKLGPWIVVAAFAGFFLVLFIVFKVLDTEVFRGDPELGGSASPIENAKTAQAHEVCRGAAVKQPGWESGRVLLDYTAWDIGFNRYLVKATLEKPDQPGRGKTYICKVSDDGGWTVQSLEFLN